MELNKYKERQLFSDNSERARRREKSCNVDLDMRKTVHDWNKVFNSSNAFHSKEKENSSSFLSTQASHSHSNNYDLNDMDLDVGLNNLDSNTKALNSYNNPNSARKHDPMMKIRKTTSFKKVSYRKDEPQSKDKDAPNQTSLYPNGTMKTDKSELNGQSNRMPSNLPKQTVLKNKVESLSEKERVDKVQSQLTQDNENKEKEKELSVHDETYIKKVKMILGSSKDICKNYTPENEGKFESGIGEVCDGIDTLLGNYKMVAEGVVRRYPLSKVVLCLRNLMRFQDAKLQVVLIVATLKIISQSNLVFDPAELHNDYFKIDDNLFFCAKLLLKYSRSTEYDCHFKQQAFLRTFTSLIDSVVRAFHTKVFDLLRQDNLEALMEFDADGERDRISEYEKYNQWIRYKVDVPYDFLTVSLGFLKNLTQNRDAYVHMDELNIYHLLEPVLSVSKLNRQLFCPYDDSQEYADVLVQALGILRNVVAFEANYNNFLYNNWVNYLDRVLQYFSYNDELVHHALGILSVVSTCRNVCAIMKSLPEFTVTLVNFYLMKSSHYNITSNVSYILTNACNYFPAAKHDCYFSYGCGELLTKLVDTYADKLLQCYEDTSTVSADYLKEIEDSLAKLLNFYNVLLLDEDIAKDSLKNVHLFNFIVDLCNQGQLHYELQLVCVNFMSIVSFYDSQDVIDAETRVDMIEALKIYLTNLDKNILIEAMRAITNLSRDEHTFAAISDDLVIKSLCILAKHKDADVVYWVLAIVVNISCHYDAKTELAEMVECILESIYQWQNSDPEMAAMGVMNLINLCERGYPFTPEHIDTLIEVKNTCTLTNGERDRLYTFYNELMSKMNQTETAQSPEDFQEIFTNIDSFIKKNCKSFESLKEEYQSEPADALEKKELKDREKEIQLNASRSKQKLDIESMVRNSSTKNLPKSDKEQEPYVYQEHKNKEIVLNVEKTIEDTKKRNRLVIEQLMKEEEEKNKIIKGSEEEYTESSVSSSMQSKIEKAERDFEKDRAKADKAQIRENTQIINTTDKTEEYLCPDKECGRKFKNKKDLDNHVSRRHK